MVGTILIAEDETVSRQNVCLALQEEGHQVYEAVDGQAALEVIDRIDFDLVVTDLKMPRANGLGVLKRVREISPSNPGNPMTAFAHAGQ